MTKVATGAAVCATLLAAAAGTVAIANSGSDEPLSGPTPAAAVSSSAVRTSMPPTSETPTTAAPIPNGPLTVADAQAALPTADATYVAADLAVQLAAVCEGASLDLLNVRPVYASLQTAEDPLRYLDAVVGVYDTVPAAEAAYQRLADDVAACPPTRTATPAPAGPEQAPVVVEVVGERRDVTVGATRAVQWVQLQSGEGTALRTAVTVVVVENAIVAVSMDADSETTSPDELAQACLAATGTTVERLSALAGR